MHLPLIYLMSAYGDSIMRRGRPKIEKVDFSAKRLQEALDYKKSSLRKLNTDPLFSASERTIRRAKQTGKINPDILDRLGRCLDVDPLFLGGEYDKSADRWASSTEEAEKIKAVFIVEDYPYILQEQRNLEALQYIKDLLIQNMIPVSEMDAMPRETQIHFFLDIERAVSKVLWQYFEPRHRSIHEYQIPMPPEDQIIHG